MAGRDCTAIYNDQNNHIKEYLDIAVEADNAVADKSKLRTSLIVKLLWIKVDALKFTKTL